MLVPQLDADSWPMQAGTQTKLLPVQVKPPVLMRSSGQMAGSHAARLLPLTSLRSRISRGYSFSSPFRRAAKLRLLVARALRGAARHAHRVDRLLKLASVAGTVPVSWLEANKLRQNSGPSQGNVTVLVLSGRAAACKVGASRVPGRALFLVSTARLRTHSVVKLARLPSDAGIVPVSWAELKPLRCRTNGRV